MTTADSVKVTNAIDAISVQVLESKKTARELVESLISARVELMLTMRRHNHHNKTGVESGVATEAIRCAISAFDVSVAHRFGDAAESSIMIASLDALDAMKAHRTDRAS